jgi:hypothetical protein
MWPAMRRIAQQPVAVTPTRALGVELHAMQRVLAVLHAHNQAVAGLGGDQAVG